MKWCRNSLAVLFMLLGFSFLNNPARADISNDIRLTAFPYYDFTNHFTIFADLGYAWNRDGQSQVFNMLSPGVYYTFSPWLQVWGGFNNRYSVNASKPDTYEIRPYLGPRLYLPNRWKINLYDYTRFEYRCLDDLETHDWSYSQRIRSRFEADFPLTSTERAWKANTWYTLTSVEPFYVFNGQGFNQLRVSGGIGYIVNNRIRVEFNYYAQFNRSDGGPLLFTENIFRLNIKIKLNKEHHEEEAQPPVTGDN